MSRHEIVGRSGAPIDPVGLSWLVTVRWTTILAGAGAVAVGRSALDAPVPFGGVTVALAALMATNLWLMWAVRARPSPTLPALAGIAVCADVVILSWLLSTAGGVLNPASVYFLVQIVLAALVLGRTWTWIVAALSVAGYAMLFLAPTDELRAAQSMHPEIARHMGGMWIAFAVTAVVIAALVSRLAIAVERRDSALVELRERNARSARAAGLATLAAGAAHELGTPLATIAVAARELDRGLTAAGSSGDLCDDARLILAQTERCRQILQAMAVQAGAPRGEIPDAQPLASILAAARARLDPKDAPRLDARVPPDVQVRWPIDIVARAVANIAQNALQASTAPVSITGRVTAEGSIEIAVEDRGRGMADADLARAGEPFFTTKAAGTGLGLFVARSSVEQLGGRFVLSSSPGVGTVATITLPRDVLAPSV